MLQAFDACGLSHRVYMAVRSFGKALGQRKVIWKMATFTDIWLFLHALHSRKKILLCSDASCIAWSMFVTQFLREIVKTHTVHHPRNVRVKDTRMIKKTNKKRKPN